jgi:hypothetical protein
VRVDVRWIFNYQTEPRTRDDLEQTPGYYNWTWNRQDAKGRSCACVVYFGTLSVENQRFSKKVVLSG